MLELKAIIGLMYLRGALHRNLSDILDVFMHESAPDIFQATMSYRCYRFIRQFLSFDRSVTQPDRYQNEKFACYRVVFEALNKQNAIMRVPSLHMTIDEMLFSYRGHISIKNYNPNKPAINGLLFISISDAEVPYTYYSLPNAGKPEIPNKYYVPGTDVFGYEASVILRSNWKEYNDGPLFHQPFNSGLVT